jgi:hypothetical protein
MPPACHAPRQNLFNDESIGGIVRQQMLERDRQKQDVQQNEQRRKEQRHLEQMQLDQLQQNLRQQDQRQQEQRQQEQRQQEQRQQEQRQDARSRGSLIRELESMRRQGEIQKRQFVKTERLDDPEPNQRLLAQASNCGSRRTRDFHHPELSTRSNQTDGMTYYYLKGLFSRRKLLICAIRH